MRYPVKSFKTEWNGTAGYGFGAKTSYGYHEGVDINDNLGGNSDLGKEILCIANGELVYYHSGKHPTTGFGYHSVYKISGSWGTRWVHQAHCMPDLTIASKTVSENEVIARVGNSGTTYAHIHFAIFKVDPATLPSGIDTIAKTLTQLNDWWEDPIAFIEKWMNASPIQDQQAVIDELRLARDKNWQLYLEQAELVKQKDTRITELEGQVKSCESEKKQFQDATITLNNKIADLNQAMEKDAVEDADVTIKLKDAEMELEDVKTQLDTLLKALGAKDWTEGLSVIDKLREPDEAVISEWEKLYEFVFTELVKKRLPKTKSLLERFFNRIRGVK